VARYFFTTEQIINQVWLSASYSPVWDTNICIGLNCKMHAAKCFTNAECIQTNVCIVGCMNENVDSWERVAACAYICEMTYGYENEEFFNLMGCMLDNQCLVDYPDDGPCIGTDQDALKNITSLEQIEGDWWVIRGVNCGQSAEYPGGYDWYPCQQERFTKNKVGQWMNTCTYCAGQNNECTTGNIVTMANISLPQPGVVEVLYLDAPLEPQHEHWRIVSQPHPDYALVLWCGRLPVMNYNGIFVISRKRNDKAMPKYAVEEFRRVLKQHAINWDDMCPSDNEHCIEKFGEDGMKGITLPPNMF